MQNAIWSLCSMTVGSIITWFVARLYYERAARDLESVTKQIGKLLRITLQALEDSGMVTLNKDSSGQIIGMVYSVSPHLAGTAHLEANPTKSDTRLPGQDAN